MLICSCIEMCYNANNVKCLLVFLPRLFPICSSPLASSPHNRLEGLITAHKSTRLSMTATASQLTMICPSVIHASLNYMYAWKGTVYLRKCKWLWLHSQHVTISVSEPKHSIRKVTAFLVPLNNGLTVPV